MPSMAAITIADGAATPVDHVFNPSGQYGARAEWANRAPSIPAGFETLTHEYVKPATSTAAHRIKIGMNLPTVATVDGSLQVVRNSSLQLVFNVSQQSTAQEREDLITLLINLLNDGDVFSSVQDLEQFW